MFLILVEFSKVFGDRAVCCAQQANSASRCWRSASASNSFATSGIAIALALIICTTCLADSGKSLVSSQSELLRYLQRPVTLTWRGAPIHSSLNRLSDLYQIGVVVDRRVDPATELNLSIQQSAFLRVIVAAAAQSDLHVEVIGPCVYVGPPSSARLGPLLLEIANNKVAALPSRKRVHW